MAKIVSFAFEQFSSWIFNFGSLCIGRGLEQASQMAVAGSEAVEVVLEEKFANDSEIDRTIMDILNFWIWRPSILRFFVLLLGILT